jgi:hypothetical protein
VFDVERHHHFLLWAIAGAAVDLTVRNSRSGAYPRFLGFPPAEVAGTALAYRREMPASYDRTVERVARACQAHDDARSLRLALLDDIRSVVAFDAYAWLIADPETEVGSAPLADVPSELLPELPRLIRLKYLTPTNRWTGLAGPVGLLVAATGGQPQRSRLWQELLAGYGVVDVASVVFRDRHGCWGFLDLWRTGGPGPFSDGDAAYL